MVAQVNTACLLHNQIKITTKLQNNHHLEPSETELNGSLTTMELKKPHPYRLVGGVQMWDGQVPHPIWWIKIWKGYLGSEKSPPHTRAPSPGFQCQEDKSP